LKEANRVSSELLSPIPGKVLKVLVSVGAMVTEDEELLTIESMKMENNIYAPAPGKVMAIHVKENDNVDVDDLLMVFEA
jgi:biotin carboxyl carrier protein